ncbi:MAG: hypothetical protein QNJ98_20510, partial [Planctomycetota bacterium]|nr:hypothetical protein [Planctomycetota bacterium]
MIRAYPLLLGLAVLVAFAWPAVPTSADEPEELVHVPIEEMDVLLKSGKRGIVLRYDEYKALVDAARKRRELLEAEPPVDGALVSADGTLDARPADAARFELTYDVRVLASGPRSVRFPVGGFAIERLTFSEGEGLFEERRGRPRLYFETSGPRRVRVQASAQYSKKGESRLLDMLLPPAAAMGVTLRLPAGYDAIVVGEGPAIRVPAKAQAHTMRVRPGRTGRLRLAMAPAAKGTDGPPILDSHVHGVHTVADGVIKSQIGVTTDVLRTAVSRLSLRVPADLAVLDLGGDGVTGFRRSADRERIDVDLAKPVLGRVGLKLTAESAYTPGPAVAPPRVRLADAIRHREHVGLYFGDDVKLRGVTPTGGRRIGAGKGRAGAFVYALAGESARVAFALEPGTVRTRAVSTYYLNLGETGKTLLATTTYRVVEGTVFTLAPQFPPGYELRNLTIDGKTTGFVRDLRPDGTLEIRLARGAPKGRELAMAATLEDANADWLPEDAGVDVPLRVPSAGTDTQEGLVAVGADASYEVLESARTDLVPVGAGELTARGIAAAGLVYGYRLDGETPSITLGVKRREPLVTADVVTAVDPSPRRLQLSAMVIHRIDRAPIRRLFVDVPAWAGDEVRFAGGGVRAWNRLTGDDAPADVPEGYARWRVDLDRRVIGRHVLSVSYHADQDVTDWRVEADLPLSTRIPVEKSERMLVVRRAEGLEVAAALPESDDVRALDISELPAEAAVNPLAVLEVVRLANGANGIGLSVTKHDGAAVLDAIATEVLLSTAVASEGILRTRCLVTLFNVDRQFLGVRLPPKSELLGAVVGGKPVKPLAKEDGMVLLPVPTANVEGARVVAAFTYETQLGDRVGGEVEIEGPAFENLEVLHTTHRVAFEPSLAIDAVEGSFTSRALEVARPRKPLITDVFLVRGGAASAALDEKTAHDAGIFYEAEIDDHVETDNDLPFEESFGAKRRSRPRAPAKKPAAPQPVPDPSGPVTGDAPAAAVVPPPAPMAPGMPAPGDEDADEEDAAPGESGHEGAGSPFQPQTRRDLREAARRKGLLSLDIPVLLAPNEVIAYRLGSGGRMTIHVADPDTEPKVWGGLLLLFVVGGLVASRFGRAARWGSVGGIALVALLVFLLLGDAASTLSAALFDAATILVLMHGLHFVGRWLVGAPRVAATTALVLAGFVLAPFAHADEPRPTPPKVEKDGPIYVPYDPADAADIETHDKVFLPLDTYLELYKAAHPEADPELVALGRYVTLLDATYELAVERGDAEGRVRYAFAKRGEGLELVGLPIGGMAITEATLDGEPVRLLLDRGLYRLPLEGAGRHTLELRVHVPVVRQGDRRRLGFQVPAHAGARLRLAAPGFAGRMEVNGAGRVRQGDASLAPGWEGEAWLGRTHKVRVALVDPAPDALPAEIVTRAVGSTLFSLREDGT